MTLEQANIVAQWKRAKDLCRDLSICHLDG